MNGIDYSLLQPDFSRRVINDNLHKICPSMLSQTIDVNTQIDKNKKILVKWISRYFIYGWERAVDEIIRISYLGIEYISLRFISPLNNQDNIEKELSIFEKILFCIQQKIQCIPVKLIIDPFGLALTEYGQWGIMNNYGNFDLVKTYNLLERVGFILSQNNIYGVITLGRIPQEVTLTKKGITAGGGKTKIYSFSHNSETSTAYIYLDNVLHNTGQKIIPSNIIEMDLWALIDIYHGTDVSVIKPMESYHLMNSLKFFINNENARNNFLQSSEVADIAMKHNFIGKTLKDMLANPTILANKCTQVKLSGYAVSGTTYMLSLLAQKKGIDIARLKLEEMWLIAFGIMNTKCECLIDRNSSYFLENSILC